MARQSIFFKRIFRRWMDARIKSGHDKVRLEAAS
jgi:hypothetical protein